jgi:hypothetical protein|tara:strand:- start:533 stop:1129 length:597 start_codon:yes stop_codon:yes gene_type:complete
MGRKHREERREKREDFVAKRSHQKRKSTLLAVGILGLIGLIVGYASFTFVTTPVGAPGSPPGAGILGDEHEHASVLVRIFGDKFDFAATTYQIKSSWIHFEESDGNTVHRHSSGVTLNYLFESLGIGIDEDCYIFGDGRQFCTNEDYSLKYFINGDSVNSINDYVVQNDDRILISYGGETEEQVIAQLNELDSQIIRD